MKVSSGPCTAIRSPASSFHREISCEVGKPGPQNEAEERKGAENDNDEEVSMAAGGNTQPSTGEAAGLLGGREIEVGCGL